MRVNLYVALLGAICLAGWALAANAAAPKAKRAGQRTSVVVILADDLSTDVMDTLLDAGLMPNLQRYIIDEGITFNNSFVTNPICCPSRTTFLTGQYSHHHQVLSNHGPAGTGGIASPGWFPAGGQPGYNEATLPTALQAVRVRTGHVGKYLNGYGFNAPETVTDAATYVPPGYNDWQGLIDPTTYLMFNYDLNDNATIVQYGDTDAEYQTDVLAGRAVDFIAANPGSRHPLFLLIAPLAPHVEIPDVVEILETGDPALSFGLTVAPAPRHVAYIDGDPGNGEIPDLPAKASFNEADVTDKPSCPRAPPEDGLVFGTPPLCVADRDMLDTTHVAEVQSQFKAMAASMLAVDDLIGEVVNALSDKGLLDHTMLVFTSDNGWQFGEHRLSGKNTAYEEVIRVPLYIRMPGGGHGVSTDAMVSNNDLAPTIAHVTGAKLRKDPDGVSLAPLLIDPQAVWNRKTLLIENFYVESLAKDDLPTYRALRAFDGVIDYLYVAWRSDKDNPDDVTHRELYILNDDPNQLDSLPVTEAQASDLDFFVDLLAACEGKACTELEGIYLSPPTVTARKTEEGNKK